MLFVTYGNCSYIVVHFCQCWLKLSKQMMTKKPKFNCKSETDFDLISSW